MQCKLLLVSEIVIQLRDSFQSLLNNAVDCQIGLEVNDDKTKCMIMSQNQNAEQSHTIKNDNISFERVE